MTMVCNCHKRQRNQVTSSEVTAMEEANRQAQAAAERLIVAEAARIAAEAVTSAPDIRAS
jgi:hypothetical protein